MHDIVIISDLHLGRGKNPETGRYYRLESFFFDDDLESFCTWLCRQAEENKTEFKLILNGDTFDLLRIDPDPEEPAETRRERRFGPLLTPSAAATTMEKILDGHSGFIGALCRVLSAGHSIVILPGNHDPEVQWPRVQQVIRNYINARIERDHDRDVAVKADELLTFEPWFYYEPGRIWVEHGNQYDNENSFNFHLRSRLDGMPDAIVKAEKDVPLGTFFQRYLFNAFGNITFIVPSGRANARYFRWLLLNKPRLMARVAFSHGPFFVQVLRRIANAASTTEALRKIHELELSQLAERSGLGETLYTIEGQKRVLGGAGVIMRTIFRQIFKIAGLGLLLILLVAGLWFIGFHAISEMHAGFGLKALVSAAFNLLFLSGTVGAVVYFLVRPPSGLPTRPMRRAAEKIIQATGVPIVTFGHTHDEIVWHLGKESGPGWYYNTGTWVAVFTHDELLPRERVQYTFLRVRDTKAELLHWSPGRGEAIPVVVLDDDDRIPEHARPSAS